MKLNLFLFLLLSSFSLISCDTQEDVPVSAHRNIVLRMGMLGSNSSEAINSQQITDLSGYLFENGILVEVYPTLSVDENGVVGGMNVPINPDARLYLLANVSGMMGEIQLIKGSTTEAGFRKLTVTSDPLPAQGTPLLMTGYRDVSGILSEGRAEFSMTRGYARLDVEPTSGVVIEKIVVNQVANSVYLFAQDPVQTPDDSGMETLEKIYESPLDAKEEGTFYFYEQTGGNVEAVIIARINGVKNILKATLPGVIRRNYLYNLRVTMVDAKIEVTVQELPWQSGEITDATPDLTQKIKIDPVHSVLSEGVRINSDKDTVFIPHYGSNFKLALEADAELEVRLNGAGDGGVTVTPSTPSGTDNEGSAEIKNIFDVVTELTIPGSPKRYLYLEIRNKNLSDYYGDKIVVAIEKSTTMISGKMTQYFNGLECTMNEYADGELGIVEIPSDCELTCAGEWIKVEEETAEGNRRYRVLGGYRPNDPEADGRIQTGSFMVVHPNGKIEEYSLSRPNNGLPVVKIEDRYWCKFNLQGNARSFDDQIQITDAVAQEADLYSYLKTCPDEEYVALMGDAYKGITHTGLRLMHTGTGSASYAYRDYSTTNAVNLINNADPTKQCPPGYQIPSTAEYDNIIGNRTTRFTGEAQEVQASYTWLEKAHTVYRYKRSDIVYDGDTIPVMYLNKLELADNTPYVLFGSGSQSNNTDMDFSYVLLATVGNHSQLCGNYFTTTSKAAGPVTRAIRCIKSPVEFIY